MQINPGKLRYKITIQRHKSTFDKSANEILDWEDFKTVYANINSLYGQEYWQAAAQGAENTIVFLIRYSKELEQAIDENELTSFRIIFKDKAYKIKSYDNVDFQNKLVKIKGINNEMQY